jgi:hypothetical protein
MFWYVFQQIDLNQVLSAVPLLNFRWMAFRQIPLVGVRWCRILDGLRARNAQVTLAVTIAVSAIGVFFAQVLQARRHVRSPVCSDDRFLAFSLAIFPNGLRYWPWTPDVCFLARMGRSS